MDQPLAVASYGFGIGSSIQWHLNFLMQLSKTADLRFGIGSSIQWHIHHDGNQSRPAMSRTLDESE